MELSQYPDLKGSDVVWLGSVPKHWELIRFRFLFSFGRGLGITKANLLDEGIPCVNYGEIHSKYGFEVVPEEHQLKYVNPDYLETSKSSLLVNGDFVFADTSEDFEGSGNFTYLNSDTPTFAGYHTVIARPISADLPRYMAYLFDSVLYRYQIRKAVSGVKVFSITQEILKNCYVWLPPKEEQTQIARFLDYKTTQIDRLIEKKKALIEKLNEQRIAVITQAVTKGLNPDAPMQDSEVEWLGEVPEHWEIRPLKHYVEFIDGDRSSEYPSGGDILREGIPFLSSKNIVNNQLQLDNLQFISEKKFNRLGRGKLVENDILITVRGSIGNVAIFQPDQYPTGFINAQMTIARSRANIIPELVYHIMNSSLWSEQLGYFSYGTAQQQLSNNTLSRVLVPVSPYVAEQAEIVCSVREKVKKIDGMVAVNQQAIEKLEEYRTALITAAVTGKIDVRHVEIPAQEAI